MQFPSAHAAAQYVAEHTAQPLLQAEIESIADDIALGLSTADHVAVLAQCLALDGDCRYTRAVYLALYFAMLPFVPPVPNNDCMVLSAADKTERKLMQDDDARRVDRRDRKIFDASRN